MKMADVYRIAVWNFVIWRDLEFKFNLPFMATQLLILFYKPFCDSSPYVVKALGACCHFIKKSRVGLLQTTITSIISINLGIH